MHMSHRPLLIVLYILAGALTPAESQLGCKNISNTTLCDMEEPGPVQFLVIGDWGKGGNSGNILKDASHNTLRRNYRKPKMSERYIDKEEPEDHEHEPKPKPSTYQAPVAHAMSKWANETDVPPSFVIALGDNFYDDGVQSPTDSLWNSLWRDVYLTNYTNLRVPWYPVLGNHDYGKGLKSALAQVDRYHNQDTNDESSGLWRMKGLNYTKVFNIPGGGSVAVVFVDTTTLAPNSDRCCNEEGGVSRSEKQWRITNQMTSLRSSFARLADMKPTWLLVAGHYPVYTEGEHGDNDELIKRLLPLMEQYNVSAYLSGHDHISEHLRCSNSRTEYFVAGAGSQTSSLGDKSSVANLLWNGSDFSSFMAVRATATSLQFSFVHWNGSVVYNYTMFNPLNDAELATVSDDDDIWVPNLEQDQSSSEHVHSSEQSRSTKEYLIISAAGAALVIAVTLSIWAVVIKYESRKSTTSKGVSTRVRKKRPVKALYRKTSTYDITSSDEKDSITENISMTSASRLYMQHNNDATTTYVYNHRKSLSLPV